MNPTERLTIQELMSHSWIKSGKAPETPLRSPHHMMDEVSPVYYKILHQISGLRLVAQDDVLFIESLYYTILRFHPGAYLLTISTTCSGKIIAFHYLVSDLQITIISRKQ